MGLTTHINQHDECTASRVAGDGAERKDFHGDLSLLERALNSPLRRRYGFNILFAGYDKAPTLIWKRWKRDPQSDEDIRACYTMNGS